MFKAKYLSLALVAATLMPASAQAAPELWAASKSNAAKGNIVTTVVSSPDHQTLEAAVKAADLVSTLASGGPFTVFAPTDAAFAELPAGTLDTLLKAENKGLLTSILTYHVVAGAVTAAPLIEWINAGGGSATLTTVQGGTLTARLVDGKVVITDAKGGTATVTTADLVQKNGVIHVTDGVFLPN